MKGRRFPKNVNALVDYDYVQRLNPKDRAFLERFSDEFYGASFSDAPLHRNEEQRRELGRVKSHRVEDIYELGARSTAAPEGSASSTEAPTCVESTVDTTSAEYRAVLSAFRAKLPTDGRRKVRLTPDLVVADANLRAVTGATSSVVEGERYVATNRLEKLKATRETVWNIGVLLAKSMVRGDEAAAVANGLNWLEGFIAKLDEKLKAMGAAPGGKDGA